MSASPKKRITRLIDAVSAGLHERREHVAVALLAALSGQNIFLLGPPGTAKSMLARRLKSAFVGDSSYFEYLMQRFSTPEEIFGPVSITELKKDKYVRKTEGFLPQANFAFLDEIWKSSPAILNTLLTIINEKTFRNGIKIENVPLQSLIAASNETPPDNQGLEALYDRFIVRLHVPPMKQMDNFCALLTDAPANSDVNCDNIAVQSEELKQWREKIYAVQLSPETILIIQDIRLQLVDKADELNIYVSDRRWQKAAILLKAAAFFCGRESTNLMDTLLLRHCLWTTVDNREAIGDMLTAAVKKCGFTTELDGEEMAAKKEKLETDIKKELYYGDNVYKTQLLSDGKEYFAGQFDRGTPSKIRENYYVAADKIKSDEEFHPIDDSGNDIEEIRCNFHGQSSYAIRGHHHYYGNYRFHVADEHWEANCEISPQVVFAKGERRQDINHQLINALTVAIKEIAQTLTDAINEIGERKRVFEEQINTPFVPAHMREIAMEGVDLQLAQLRVQLKDCDLLLKLIEE